MPQNAPMKIINIESEGFGVVQTYPLRSHKYIVQTYHQSRPLYEFCPQELDRFFSS